MKRTLYLIISILIYFSVFTSCSKSIDETESSITPDGKSLDEAFTQAKQIANLKSLVVFHGGNIVREEYFRNGSADAAHDVRSVTKTVVGLLVGIAIDKGYIKSIDQPIGDFLSPIAGNISLEKAAIKIRHLLTMSSGFQWEELISSGYNDWITSPNQMQYLLNKPLVYQTGQTFTYNSAGVHLLSIIITQATQMSTVSFAKQYLFEPLGIGDRNWEVDKQGYCNGGAGLRITPHDMIKIGRLILNCGEYNGNRIVSTAWIDQSILSQISTNNAQPYGPSYGYCLWIGQNEKGNYAFANGWGGQFIVIHPNLELVASATNEWSGVTTSVANDQWYRTISLIMTKIIPVVQ
jgi:CubicO group peptidase (beta-lactamase class C family)